MSVKTYKTGWGTFSTIEDTALYDQVNVWPVQGKTLYQSGQLTSDGIAFMTDFNVGQLFPVLMMRSNQFLPLTLQAIRAVLPNIITNDKLRDLPLTTTATWYTEFFENSLKGISLELRYYTNSYNVIVDATKGYNNGVRTNAFPRYILGLFKGEAYDVEAANYAKLNILVFNDDRSAAKYVTITADKNGTVTALSYTFVYVQEYNDLMGDIDPAEMNEDPYEEAGTSETGGGTGSFDLTSDSVDFPSLPTLTAVSTGLVSVYAPSLGQLNALANFLWNANPTDVDWWKKLVANPLDLILGLSIVPVSVPIGSAQTIKVGLVDTQVSVNKASTQFVEVDCGSIQVDEYWGSALDYSPFRRFSIYLPFIGTRTISTDDIMNKTVHVKYHVDLLSGACVAMVKCGDAVLYQYSGACAVSLPLTGETFTNVITSTIQLAASIGATVATGGAASGVTAASAANSLMSMKPIVERAGGVSGAAGQLGVMYPYLIGEIPRQSVPANCNTFKGYPSNIKATISELSGYTEVDTIFIKGIEATQAELDELESILKGGFII